MNPENDDQKLPRAPEYSVSCIIPTYNRANFLRDAVSSVQNQTHPVDEIIIIDDGSTDHTSSVIRSIPDRRIRYTYQPNAGISSARNHGIRLSSGKVIAFLDSDDIWVPNKLERQLDCLSRGHYGLVYCAKSWMDATGAEIENPYPQKTFPHGSVFRELFLSNFITSASCVIALRRCFDDVGLFTESADFSNGQDYELWLRIAHAYRVGAVPEEMVRYRTHQANQTGTRPRRYRGTLSAVDKASRLDPDRVLLRKRDHRVRLRHVYTLAVSEFFYTKDLTSCKQFGHEALAKRLISPTLLMFTLLAHFPESLLTLAQNVWPW